MMVKVHEEIPSPTAAESSPPLDKRRRIRFFSGSDSSSFEEAGVMVNHSSPTADAGVGKMYAAGLAEGYFMKCLFKSPDPDGFSLSYAWFKGNYELPPHKHDTDCLYYVIAGNLHMGKRNLGAGDGFFLPGGTGYSYSAGPDGVEVLEFRDTSHFDITIRDGSPAAWQRLAQVCADNKELWKRQVPPSRNPKDSSR